MAVSARTNHFATWQPIRSALCELMAKTVQLPLLLSGPNTSFLIQLKVYYLCMVVPSLCVEVQCHTGMTHALSTRLLGR